MILETYDQSDEETWPCQYFFFNNCDNFWQLQQILQIYTDKDNEEYNDT